MSNDSKQPTTSPYETGLQKDTGLPPQQVVYQNGSARESAVLIAGDSVNKQMSLIGGKRYKKRYSHRRRKTQKTHRKRKTQKTHRRRKTQKTHRRRKHRVFKGGNPNAQPIKPATIEPPKVPPTGGTSLSADQKQNTYNNLTALSAGSVEQSKYDNPSK